MRRKDFARPLAAILLPLALAACVSGEGGMTGIAEIGASPAPAQEAIESAAAPSERPEGEASDASIAALAPAPSRPGSNGTISGSAAIDRMIEEAAAEQGVPRELAFAVVHVESRYNPKAVGRGVYGLSQIMPATARSMGFSGSVEDLMEPSTNLRYGMRYLKGAWEKGGRDICQASMKYKGGHRATTMTRSAQTYCANVKRHIAQITGQPAPSGTLVASAAEAAPAASAASAMAPSPRPASAASAAIESARAPAVAEAPEMPEVAEAAAPAAPTEVAAAPAELGAASFAEPDSARFGD